MRFTPFLPVEENGMEKILLNNTRELSSLFMYKNVYCFMSILTPFCHLDIFPPRGKKKMGIKYNMQINSNFISDNIKFKPKPEK